VAKANLHLITGGIGADWVNRSAPRCTPRASRWSFTHSPGNERGGSLARRTPSPGLRFRGVRHRTSLNHDVLPGPRCAGSQEGGWDAIDVLVKQRRDQRADRVGAVIEDVRVWQRLWNGGPERPTSTAKCRQRSPANHGSATAWCERGVGTAHRLRLTVPYWSVNGATKWASGHSTNYAADAKAGIHGFTRQLAHRRWQR
jgi:hypothetical protein